MSQPSREQQIAALEKDWAENPRWKGIKRNYTAADVVRLRGSLQPEYTLAQAGAKKLWEKVNGGAKKGYVNAFGAITAGQAMQQAKALTPDTLTRTIFDSQQPELEVQVPLLDRSAFSGTLVAEYSIESLLRYYVPAEGTDAFREYRCVRDILGAEAARAAFGLPPRGGGR